jgi:hypothetical protein
MILLKMYAKTVSRDLWATFWIAPPQCAASTGRVMNRTRRH